MIDYLLINVKKQCYTIKYLLMLCLIILAYSKFSSGFKGNEDGLFLLTVAIKIHFHLHDQNRNSLNTVTKLRFWICLQ